ncbi:MAG: hypothetical protein ABIS35_15675 [Terracoccus sp.]
MNRATAAAVLVALATALAGCASAAPPVAPVAPAPSSASTSPSTTGRSGTPTARHSPTTAATPSSSASAPATTGPPAGGASAGAQLPGGGRTLFPEHRLVGFAGVPGSRAMGRLGIGDLDDRAQEILEVGEPYADGRKVLPVLELIATIVQGAPGRDGKYRSRVSAATVDRHLAAAREVNGILLLGIQPGRADFLTEVKHYERWLVQPDVGLALDPEWAMGPGQVPMMVFGHTTGAEIDSIAAYLAGLVKAHDLPEKALVFHQLSPAIVSRQKDIRMHPGVAIIKSVDGIGSPANKVSTWTKLTKNLPKGVHAGFKLFYEEDRAFGPLMTPKQVLALRPEPDYVLYE